LSALNCPQAQPYSKQASELGKRIASIKSRLVKTYTTIKTLSPDSRIYVYGYPQFISDREIPPTDIDNGGFQQACNFNVRLSLEERQMAITGVSYMNDVVEAAAKDAGVFYVDVENILDGHKHCEDIPKENVYVNGVTTGNDIKAICKVKECFGNETYHPTEAAQELYRDQILSETNGLTASMPNPEPTFIPLPPEVFGALAYDYVVTENALSYSSSVVIPEPGEFITTNQSVSGIELQQGNVYPGSELRLEVESDPVVIDVYESNREGLVNAVFDLPSELQPGTHTLYIYYVDTFGLEQVKYESVIVGASADDFDGDGVADESDSCMFTINNNVDLDNDSVDDACDDEITVTPPPPEPQEPKICTILYRIEKNMPRFLRHLFNEIYRKFGCNKSTHITSLYFVNRGYVFGGRW
jgi:hypothetical protein